MAAVKTFDLLSFFINRGMRKNFIKENVFDIDFSNIVQVYRKEVYDPQKNLSYFPL